MTHRKEPNEAAEWLADLYGVLSNPEALTDVVEEIQKMTKDLEEINRILAEDPEDPE
jgi:hypothetical protein